MGGLAEHDLNFNYAGIIFKKGKIFLYDFHCTTSIFP